MSVAVLVAVFAGGSGAAAPSARAEAVRAIPVCGAALALTARCHAWLFTPDGASPHATTSPTGLSPAQLLSAYNLPSPFSATWTWNGQTIAIVDAYDNPKAEADLATYRNQFGLSPCTTANTCFKKVDQNGGTSYPRPNQGWALEIALDVQMASAICPNCKILLVEAASNSFANLIAAVDRAATLGAQIISNSYGGSEFSSETSATYDGHFNKLGVAITVSSGDSGYGVEFPAASQYVTAVGGTTLTAAANTRGWTETAWSGAGSGCSAYETRPPWQNISPINTLCARRAVADVSFDADPSSGVSVYDSYGYYGQKGWFKVGGTSVGAPAIAGVYGLAGNASSVINGSYPYSHTTSLFDITSGSNGSCGSSALCTAKVGWDGPTGLGTPNGTGGF